MIANRSNELTNKPATLQKIRFLLLGATILLLSVQTSLAGPFISGIDVSRYQGDINWSSVKNAGIEFAFCKATEGVDFVDIKYLQNMNNASAAGVLIGPYHFARPDSQESNPNDAINEANDFVDAIEPYYQQPGNFLRPVLDVERRPTPGEFPPGMTQKQYLSEWVRDFVSVVVDRLGFEPIIYANTDFALHDFESDIAQYDLWLANWNYTPPSEPPVSQYGIWSDYAFWQYTNSGSVSGVSGAVDRDVFEGTMDELREFLAVPPEPTADFDEDGDVDGRDFLAWQRRYGIASGAALSQGDADHNGVVNGADLAVWQSAYGGGPLGAVTAVPEPGLLALASLLVAAICGWRRAN